MENSNKISQDEVIHEFDRRAKEVGGNDSVLDASSNKDASYSNIYRDYISKYMVNKHLSPSKKDVILDYGCGVGRLSHFFAKGVKKIIALDISQEMILLAKKENKNANIVFNHITSNEFSYKEEKLTKIFTYWVLQHVGDDQINVLGTSFYKSLLAGGKVFLFEQIEGENIVQNNIIQHRKEADYIRLFEANGFTFLYSKPILRMPSYGLDLWKKVNLNLKIILYLATFIEKLTLTYKKKEIIYETRVLVFEKT